MPRSAVFICAALVACRERPTVRADHARSDAAAETAATPAAVVIVTARDARLLGADDTYVRWSADAHSEKSYTVRHYFEAAHGSGPVHPIEISEWSLVHVDERAAFAAPQGHQDEHGWIHVYNRLKSSVQKIKLTTTPTAVADGAHVFLALGNDKHTDISVYSTTSWSLSPWFVVPARVDGLAVDATHLYYAVGKELHARVRGSTKDVVVVSGKPLRGFRVLDGALLTCNGKLERHPLDGSPSTVLSERCSRLVAGDARGVIFVANDTAFALNAGEANARALPIAKAGWGFAVSRDFIYFDGDDSIRRLPRR